MKVNCKVLLLVCLISSIFISCKEDDENAEDLSNVDLEILLNTSNEVLDTDLIDLDISLTNGPGSNVNYRTIKWTSDKDGALINSKFNNLYFLSADHHKITCEVTLSDNSVIAKSVELNVTDDPRGNWSLNSFYTGAGADIFTPDELVLETPNFIIYSNTEDPSKRLYASDYAEQGLRELKEVFNESDFNFEGKVTIGHNKDSGSGFISSYPSYSMYVGMPEDGFVPLSNTWNFNREGIKHELMHLTELTFLKGSSSENTSHRWFWEGIAVYVSNGEIPSTWQEVTDWQNNTNGNPVSIQEQPTGNNSNDGDYYPMFGLSVKYLLHTDGQNKTYDDIKNLYNSIKEGATFEDAFQNHFGLTVTAYEANFFTLIQEFLQ